MNGGREIHSTRTPGVTCYNEEDFSSDSSKTCSTPSPHRATLQAAHDPYVSFGEDADSVYKRVQTAAHKHCYALDSNELLFRLQGLPTENEYVPRLLCDLSPILSDSNATAAVTPSYYQRSPSYWEELEKEARRRTKSLYARFRLKSVVDQSSLADLRPIDPSSAEGPMAPSSNSIQQGGGEVDNQPPSGLDAAPEQLMQITRSLEHAGPTIGSQKTASDAVVPLLQPPQLRSEWAGKGNRRHGSKRTTVEGNLIWHGRLRPRKRVITVQGETVWAHRLRTRHDNPGSLRARSKLEPAIHRNRRGVAQQSGRKH